MIIKSYSILVVDDQDDIREMIAYQLQAIGYTVQTATNGIEALNRLSAFKPDLIILDITMPQMNGIEFYQKICNNDGIPKYQVVMHTARAQLEELFLDFHVAGFLTKPVNLDELLSEINLVLKVQNRQRDSLTGRKIIKKILIVEDDKDEYLKIQTVFENSGYQIDNTNTGVNAILKTINAPPDVVLTKLKLKDISGDILALRLKTMARTTDIISILYVNSVNATPEIVVIFDTIKAKTGVEDFVIIKDPQDLLDAVDKLLR